MMLNATRLATSGSPRKIRRPRAARRARDRCQYGNHPHPRRAILRTASGPRLRLNVTSIHPPHYNPINIPVKERGREICLSLVSPEGSAAYNS